MILAKSISSGVSLLRHTRDVVEAARLLFGSEPKPTRLAERWRCFFKVDDFSIFHATLIAAAGFHDIGKANDGFDAAVRRKGDQVIRHEHLSGLIVCLDEVDSWVRSNTQIDREVMLSAVISHHLKVKEDSFAKQLSRSHSFRLLTNDDEWPMLLRLIAESSGLDEARLPDIPKDWDFQSGGDIDVDDLREDVIEERLVAIGDWVDEPDYADRHRLLQAVRSALIVADAIGSAEPRLQSSLQDFIHRSFDESKLIDSQAIWQSVVDPRLDQLRALNKWDDNKGEAGWNAFQTASDKLPSRALLLAPCGSGKTLAAWRWIAAQCQRPVSRVIFLYPTRATATEGFRDYVSWAPEADAALMHGTAEYDLDGMFENPAETSDNRDEKSFEVEQRLFALGFWGKRIFSATVDQFLAFMQHGYAATCMLPLLADSVVVVDEAHSFDESMFAALKGFLEEFDVPVLCMTATLPQTRTQVLDGIGLYVSADHPADLREIAEAPRYEIEDVGTRAEAERRVRDALSEGKRVLWVVNQVRRSQEIVQLFRDSNNDSPLQVDSDTPLFCYHSRFRLMDRRDRHREVVAAIRPDQSPALAVTTQVCEMSLDLDADMIVTEYAPVTSLIQRMGRCNRAREPRPDAGRCLFYEPGDSLPYDDEQMQQAMAFLSQLTGRRINQADLEKALRQLTFVPDLPKQCGFLTSAPYAMARDFSFRNIEEFTVAGLLDCDVEAFTHAGTSQDGYVVPVPRNTQDLRTEAQGNVPKYLRIVSEESYNHQIGFVR